MRREGSRDVSCAEVAVVGLGNPYRGDDGVGPAVVRLLESALGGGAPAGVDLLEIRHTGLRLAEAILGYGKVLIVDAAPWLPLGEVRRIPLEALPAGAAGSHGLGLRGALAALRRIGEGVPEVEVLAIGVRGGRMGFGEGLSPAVAAAVSRAAEEVMGWLREAS